MKELLLKSQHRRSIPEEVMNALTHAVAAGLSLVGTVILLVLAIEHYNSLKIVAISIYGATLILMYAASTIYHSIQHVHVKHAFRILDHLSIYLLIAGTYTPFCLIVLQNDWGWTLFWVIWTLAILGVIFKIFFVNRIPVLSTIMYVLMGWLVVIAIDPLWHALPFHGLAWLFAGGMFYTLGVVFYVMDRVRFAHTIWHLFVIAGSLCHYLAIFWYVMPLPVR